MILIGALIFSKTLGGYLTFVFMFLAISIFLLIFNKEKRITLIRIISLIILFVTIFSLISINDKKYLQELKSSKEEVENLLENNENFGTSRAKIWKKSLMMIKDNWLLGVGPDSMKAEFAKYFDYYLTDGQNDYLNKRQVDKAHSEYLHIAVTTGIPSVIIIAILEITIIIKSFKYIVKNYKNKKAINNIECMIIAFLACVSYLIQSQANISVVQVAPSFWAMLGILAGELLINKDIDILKN